LNVAIFIFPDIETLDFCGPLEVFSAANLATAKDLFNVYTFARELKPLKTINGLQVIPEYDFNQLPHPDILIIPGGEGTKAVINQKETLQALNDLSNQSGYTFSVCSGARILAVMGLMEDKEFTTHHSVFEDVGKLAPTATPRQGERFTDNGKILTAAGVAAGIDLALHLLEKVTDRQTALATSAYMEYPLRNYMTYQGH
jgi:transcriptional regulator GlxA family with amidase domain